MAFGTFYFYRVLGRPRGRMVPIKTESELNPLFPEIETGTGKHSTSQHLRNKHTGIDDTRSSSSGGQF